MTTTSSRSLLTLGVLAGTLALIPPDADARRFGGGRSIGMSEATFHRGFKELLLNRFLAPRSANLYWVNAALFFKGDRVAFVKEYRRKKSSPQAQQLDPTRDPNTIDWVDQER